MSEYVSGDLFAAEIQEFKKALSFTGIHGALGYLNNRTPHRYTGFYRYDGDTLRNLALYDKYNPDVKVGEDVPLVATYCSLLQKEDFLEITDAATDARVKGIIITPVTSYSGVVVSNLGGSRFGSLCHFDMNSCQVRQTDFPLLEAVSKILNDHFFPEDNGRN